MMESKPTKIFFIFKENSTMTEEVRAERFVFLFVFFVISQLSEDLLFKKKTHSFSNKTVYSRTQEASSLFHPGNLHMFE